VTEVVKFNALLSGVVHIIVFNAKPDPEIESLAFKWADLSTILAIATIIYSCVYSIVKGFRTGFFILAGLLVFLVGALQRLLLTSTYSSLYPPSIFHLGMVLETFIISFGLIYRYRLDRREKQQYLKEKEALQNNIDKLLLESKFEIQEKTLNKISQEIHDNIGQVLTLVKINLTNLGDDRIASEQRIDHSIKLITTAIKDLRDLSKSLDAEYVMEKGLLRSIEYELEQLNKVGVFTTELEITGMEYRLEPQKELIIFRIYQEVINNAIKHSGAKKISVQLQFEPEIVSLIVKDNGNGFDINSALKNRDAGLGIRNMHNRSGLIGANFQIESEMGVGTTVSMKIPKGD
jgi:signal transduction histidine kinase